MLPEGFCEPLALGFPVVEAKSLLSLSLSLLVALALASRTRFVVLPIVPSLISFVVALVLTGGRPVGAPLAPFGLLVGALVVLLVRTHPHDEAVVAVSRGPGRIPAHQRFGVPLLAGAALGGVTLASADARAQSRPGPATRQVIYELRTYHLVNGPMRARLDAYLREAFIPAARRAGCGPGRIRAMRTSRASGAFAW